MEKNLSLSACAALLLASSVPAFADHNDHPAPGVGIRCTTENDGRWYGLRDLNVGADTRFVKQAVIAMCQHGSSVSDANCVMHAACSSEPLTAYVCSANTTSDPGRVYSAWASAETVGYAQQQVIAQCVARAYTLRDRLRCENTARTCLPATRADLESEPIVAAAPLPPPPPPVALAVCSAQAFGVVATTEPFVMAGEVVMNQQKDQAILRCVENFRLDSPGRRMVAQRECRETATCRVL